MGAPKLWYIRRKALDKVHAAVLIPAAVKHEPEIVNVQHVAERGLVLDTRYGRELDDGRHFAGLQHTLCQEAAKYTSDS